MWISNMDAAFYCITSLASCLNDSPSLAVMHITQSWYRRQLYTTGM
jgi:hypothetical protein